MENKLYKDKFRIESTRLPEMDYSLSGAYFVTICVKEKDCLFGEVIDGKIELSAVGEIVSEYWRGIKLHFKNTELDEFIIMPNHIHGIIYIVEKLSSIADVHSKFSNPIKGSLSVIVGQFKSSVKRWCNKNGYNHFCWQSRFYDRVIRDEKELLNIRQYINNNPVNWKNDDENPQYDR